MEKPTSIKEVQVAEQKAKLILDNALAEKESSISKAASKAQKNIDESIENSKKIHEKTLRDAELKLISERKEALSKAHKDAAKLKKSSMNKTALEKAVKIAIKEILGM
ncbi:MAG: hypothetical protein M1122_01775 [Candidatus Marsarchaeota archaeon]|jgi:vacuolar-type H+-ATPase subunit H|nr:hypothetical protein [Candidatus Marsarchaeota archaeon]